jgi:hypothetical protein
MFQIKVLDIINTYISCHIQNFSAINHLKTGNFEMTRWKNYFCLLLTVCGIKDVWQTEIHTGKPLVPEPGSSEVENAIEKLKRCELPDTGHSVAELVHTGNIHYILRSTNVIILFQITMNCHSNVQNVLFYLFITRVIKWTVAISKGYHCYQPHINCFQCPSVKVNFTCTRITEDH